MTEPIPTTISKEYRWEMGHRLSYHTEGCQNLHGHSYRICVTLTGTLNQGGMVFDFGDITRIIKPIIDELDHSTMLHENDQPLVDFLVSQGMKLSLVPFHPTTEELAAWFLGKIAEPLKPYSNISELQVTIFETATSTVTLTHKLS
ncbi:MAG: 6-carboxytetrahydropterin synthase [Fimbriimonadaceae bacterium]|nr:6-carboxytetrahydropterin synthase [Fimbriimonadaceae bacterium]